MRVVLCTSQVDLSERFSNFSFSLSDEKKGFEQKTEKFSNSMQCKVFYVMFVFCGDTSINERIVFMSNRAMNTYMYLQEDCVTMSFSR